MKVQKEFFRSVFVFVMFISGFVGISMAQTVGFQGLGDLPGGAFESAAYAVSADGSVVVGVGCPVPMNPHLIDYEAFRWTAGSDLQGLGHISPDPRPIPYQRNSEATSAFYDGSTIVGWCFVGFSGWTGFRWDETNQMQPLNWFTPVDEFAAPTEDRGLLTISDDGNTIVGKMASGSGWEAFCWTQTNQTGDGVLIGLRDFMNEPFIGYHSAANDVSGNGTIVVGKSAYRAVLGGPGSGTYYYEAFRWTDANGNNQFDLAEMQGLGFLEYSGSSPQSSASAVTSDGSVIVGKSDSDDGSQAFLWTLTDPDTREGEMIGLGILDGYTHSNALDVSADGSIIIGTNQLLPPFTIEPESETAFLWDELNGMRDLKVVLESDYGLDLTGWELTSANSISADGYVIVGSGINPDGDPEAWIATIPEPSCFVLFSLVGLYVTLRRKNSSRL